MRSFLIYLVLTILCSSCGPRVATKLLDHYDPLDFKEEVIVLEKEDVLPKDAIKIGQVRVGDNGFSLKNNYSDVIQNAIDEARKSGGNLIQVIKHKHPDFWSTTHRITAIIYKTENTSNLNQPSKEATFLPTDVAVIHVYRATAIGSALEFDLFLGEQLLCHVKNNWKMSIQVTQEGLNTLWARTEAKAEVPIKIELGKEYYLRCSVKMGFITGRPELELVNAKTGKMEFDAIK